ncbi:MULTISPECIES: pyridoxal 5'-phosphate synthase lyase subunit PdxS [Methanohalophilus]|uniref:Pyridoxal 5'-phosphate synthase subunit PdxS n=1 Tax=Methanohalophilus euhalobius TaxID=51203 RepID=A0A285EPJ2_9EURY|nr:MULTISPECIES: pyridoxal 5'-phosphate synthase lyase subunit PdxS [Methanohalophilus]RSD34069.1 MAG: pyridoxine biosynthesis protein [Methanohalophilus sp.]ODV49498.1 MAG: pyridoxine biosynthesis protein [Methanohalophilus sp. 2-GBenrich]PQV42657.1 pyridoxal phosphate synthase yaaD subunit [Methanohalophilus euhalobius]RNI08685.1 pyridoxal 5'-phosphate synthase lyase subunit PdxS [Methanohalophilus euhalobius]RSD34242.1 MAG: pyridoxine biosynthesis protein [Methanohalophilus sp.]
MELENLRHGTELIKRGFARMQKGGVIMDVTNPEQARIAEEAGAVAVMALQAVPADIRKAGGVARMADPEIVAQIIDTVTIPVMAKARIGHFVEAEILESLGADMVDESEVLTPADEMYHIDKTGFTVPFVCGARNLGEALRRINEGAAMIRTKGEAGTGDVREAVRHMKKIMGEVRELAGKDKEELIKVARDIEAPIELVLESADLQRLPVVNFAAGGVATPADAALMMRLGADGVFVGSGIFKAENPEMMAKAVVEAVNNYDNPKKLAEISRGIGSGMKGMSADTILPEETLQTRGW